MNKFDIRKDATRPSLVVDIKHDTGTAYDITNAKGATFTMYNESGDKISNGACTITDEENGRVQYDWMTSDTDTEGKYYGYIEVTLSDDSLLRVPANNELMIRVIGVTL